MLLVISEIVEQVIYGIMAGGIYAMIGAGLSMIFGVMRFSNFAHGEFYMLGAYITYIISIASGLDPYLTAPLAAMAVGLLGILINISIIKPLYEAVGKARRASVIYFQDLNFILLTVGLSIFFVDLALIIWGPIPLRVPTVLSDINLSIGFIKFGFQRLIALVVACISLGAFYLFLKKTKIGKAIRAVSQNPTAAMLTGINIYKIYNITIFVSLFLAALAGGILSPVFNLYPRMGLDIVVKAFVVVILGGLGNIVGSIYAGFLLGIMENLGGLFLGTQYRETIGFVMMILVLWLKPKGLFGKG
ncbi:MAG: branched-chain amino acid ABC transporter permease [bacterium]|jgi:branched-chain amino acid transport system permease protein